MSRKLKDFNKAKALPLGTKRKHGGILKQKTAKGWVPVKEGKVKKQKVIKKDKTGLESVPIKGLNKDLNIDFKKNFEFLNKEIEGVKFEDEKIKDNWINQINAYEQIINTSKSEDSKKWAQKELNKINKNIKKQSIKKFENYSKNLTPIHTLNIDKFIKVLDSGGLMSLEELQNKGKEKGYRIIEKEIKPKYGDLWAKAIKQYFESDGTNDKELQNINSVIGEKKADKIFLEITDKISHIFDEEIEGAISYLADKEIQTNRHVFSLMGSDGSYGDIAIVLKQDIMKHSDFNMSPVAGTSFMSGEMYNHREWVDDSFRRKKFIDGKWQSKTSEENIIKHQQNHFHKSKLNAKENEKYYEYMAKDIAAQGSIKDYENRQSHGKWEAHLPAFVSLSMIEEVVMSKEIYNDFMGKKIDLSNELKNLGKEYDKLTKIPHNKMTPEQFGKVPIIREIIFHPDKIFNGDLEKEKKRLESNLKEYIPFSKDDKIKKESEIKELNKILILRDQKIKLVNEQLKVNIKVIEGKNHNYLNKQFNKGTYRRIHK